MSHRLVLAAAAAAPALLLCAASPAVAQDQAAWTGFYVGANMGGAWGDFSNTARVRAGPGPLVIPPADVAAINSVSSGSKSPSGFTGGVEGGYNHITPSGILLGIETDWGAMDVSQNASRAVASTVLPQLTYALKNHVSTDWIWTLRPRIGFVSGSWLVYGTAGMAVTDIKSELGYADNGPAGRAVAFSDSDTKTGWVGGLGAAYAIAPQWSVKAEWLYADFGKFNGNAASSDGFVVFGQEGIVKTNMFRAGIDYRF